ncbi:MAG: ankyrin repeat domain-containing protein [Deltaproteobacteria bacterium]|nr:ankyrin repeat domain-containing protein [Deltaproteobacteria bacterium]
MRYDPIKLRSDPFIMAIANTQSSKNELSSRYYIAEVSIWLLGGVLLVARFIGLAPSQSIPLLNITLENQQYLPRILAALLVVVALYLFAEWELSSQQARRLFLQKVRFRLTILWICATLWLSYPLIAENTFLSGISPAWYFGFLGVGFALGNFVSLLVFASLMIRTHVESKKLDLPRVPAAAIAQYKACPPIVLLLLVVSYILWRFSPEAIKWIGLCLIVVACLFVIAIFIAPFFFTKDENGYRIPYAKRIAGLKAAHDTHDYRYLIGGIGFKAIQQVDFPKDSSPEDKQKIMQQKFSGATNNEPHRFRVLQQDEIQVSFNHKDGNQNNKAPSNCGVKILKHQGKQDLMRVLIEWENHKRPPKEMEILISVVEKYAEEYLSTHTIEAELIPRKILSYAINQTVIDAMLSEAGPVLFRAVFTGREEVIRELLKKEVDVNERAEHGWTAILAASAQGYPRIVRLLLDAGANPDIANLLGITPLMYGAPYRNSKICQILIEYGANLDLTDVYGMTALMVATLSGHEGIVQKLIKAGADITIKDRKGRTALDIAHEKKRGKIAMRLRKAKIKN